MWRISNEVGAAKQADQEGEADIDAYISEYTFLKDNLYATDATPWLLLELGNAQYKAKKFDDAIQTYNEFIAKYTRHPLVPIIRQSLGYAFEEKGQLQEAIKQYEEILRDDDASYLMAGASLDAGRCYEKLEQLDPALTAYKRVIDTSPESYYAKMAHYRLEDIE